MMKTIVVDTSVFISALISAEGASRAVIRDCLLGVYRPLMSNALFHEYEAVLNRGIIKKKCPLSDKEKEELLDAFISVCGWTPIYYLWRPNLADEADNHILELAVAGNAGIVVTHNIKDFKRNELSFPDVHILKPKEILERKLSWQH